MKASKQFIKELHKIISSYEVPSKSEEGKLWEVTIDMYGNMSCNCPAIKSCRHIRIIKNKMKGNYVKEDY